MQNGGDRGAPAGAGGEGVGERDRREASVLVVVGFAFMAKKMDSMAEVSLVTRDTRGWRRFIFALLCHSSSASITYRTPSVLFTEGGCLLHLCKAVLAQKYPLVLGLQN